MTNFKFDPDKYKGHTEGPYKIIEFADTFWIVPESSDDVNDSIAVLDIEGKAYPNGKLFRDAPDILTHAVKLEAEKAELVDALETITKCRYLDNANRVADKALNKAKGAEK